MTGILMASVGNSYGSAPVNTVAPAVTGTATFGQTLTTTNGTWLGAPAPTFTYQWQRVTTNISGATSSTYVLVAADVGNTIRCVVTATNSVAPGGVSANSNSTAAVAAAVPGAPTIGTATATGSTTATVAYTAPASDGGATITVYTATSSPGGGTGTLSQAGSGTISVTGLSGGTAYTFTVKATNSVGQGAASAASNSITTVPTIGQSFGGGFFAGQISYSANSVATHNLIIAPKSGGESGTTVQWRSPPAATPGTTSTFDGASNSAQLTNAGVYPAGGFAEGLSIGGFTDWYLPALYELVVCYYNLKPTTASNDTSYGANPYAVPATGNYNGTPVQTTAGSFQSGNSEAFGPPTPFARYYTSTSDGGVNAYSMFFGGGQYDLGSQMNPYMSRAIRKVPV